MFTSRRDIVKGMGAALLLSKAGHAASTSSRPPHHQLGLTKDQWIDAVIGQLSDRGAPDGALKLGRFKDPMYFLLSPIKWKPDPGDPKDTVPVTVPTGFVTDLASIPRVFWSILRPDGDYVYPAILHDYLYWTQATGKASADLVLKTSMMDFGVSKLDVTAIYEAVHYGGRAAWDANAKARAHGERRVLRQFPADPRTTWASWKSNPSVFVQSG